DAVGGDDVTGQRLVLEESAGGRSPAEGIVDLVDAPEFQEIGEVAVTFRLGGHGGDDAAGGATRGDGLHPVVAEEEEGAVLAVVHLGNVDRSVDGATGIGDVEVGTRGSGGVGEEGVGIEFGGLFVEEGAAVDFVGAGLEADVDDAAFGRAGGDVEGRGLHLEFGNDVGDRSLGLYDGAAGFVMEGVAGTFDGKLVAAGRG